jgi:hypothetical protein
MMRMSGCGKRLLVRSFMIVSYFISCCVFGYVATNNSLFDYHVLNYQCISVSDPNSHAETSTVSSDSILYKDAQVKFFCFELLY